MTVLRMKENARSLKNRRCDSCGRVIAKGEPHYYQAHVHEDGFGTYRAHNDCAKASEIAAHKCGCGDYWTNVDEMEDDEREAVRAEDPELADRLWGRENCPSDEPSRTL